MIIDNIPIILQKTKKTRQSLNLNQFRNNHYQTNNKLKKLFNLRFKELLARADGKCPVPPLMLIYTVYRKDKRKVDLSNILSIVDKFASDSLVYYGIIPDDNTNCIKEVRYIDGGIDKNNPRATLKIEKYRI